MRLNQSAQSSTHYLPPTQLSRPINTMSHFAIPQIEVPCQPGLPHFESSLILNAMIIMVLLDLSDTMSTDATSTCK